MIKVALIGRGNVSFHLEKTLRNSSAVAVSVHDGRSDAFLADIQSVDVIIIAVSDTAVNEVSKKLLGINALVAHTSGSVSLSDMSEGLRRGVFYPLQTFSKERNVDFSEIPICIEAENQSDLKILDELARSISKNIQLVSSPQRKSLHLAAVFVNNFTNHLYHIGTEICEDQQLQASILEPLIIETAQKIRELSPFEAQTGPARRKDLETLEGHQELLKESNQKEIYSLLSKSIKKTYGKKL